VVAVTRILSIDGGGIRGLVPALVLADIEQRTSRPICELFDLIAGTSTGGIIALGLTCPGDAGKPRYRARDLVDLYLKEGRRIFPHEFLGTLRQLVRPKYAARGIEDTLHSYFGEARLNQALVDVFVPAYEIQARDPFFFRSSRARTDPNTFDYPMWAVARATSAAPTYFPPFEATALGGQRWALVDGGVFANNPAIWATVDVLTAGGSLDTLLVVSLATVSDTAKKPFALQQARGWGMFGWVRPVIDIALTGGSDATDFGLRQLLGDRAFRFKPGLPAASEELDNVSPVNLDLLVRQGEALVQSEAARLDAVCAVLTAGRE
jgi:patatin-like phospholipase/acyl hydrolase